MTQPPSQVVDQPSYGTGGPTPGIKIRARGFPDGPQPTPETPCPVCEWDGHVSWFFQRPRWRQFDEEDARARIWTPELGCAFCALRFRIAEVVAPAPGSVDMAVGHATEGGRVIVSPVEGSSSVDISMEMYQLFLAKGQKMLASHEAPMKPVKRRLIADNSTSSQLSFDFIQHQLAKCAKDHSFTCGVGTGSAFSPSRLIDVTPINEAGDISLAISQERFSEQRQPYVALSYCWGKTIPACRLLTTTLESLKRRIPWGSMPKTLQDAVTCTRRLGLRYVWIDAVCIIQDSVSDWAREAALMSDVYRNSYVTLAGLHSSESTDGLFNSQGKSNKGKGQGQTRLIDLELGGRVYTVYMFRSHAHPDLVISDDASLSPLLRRGWCFQERILSPRVVFFGADELLWECNRSSVCQCLELDHRREKSLTLKQRLAAQRRKGPDAEESMPQADVVSDDWRSIVSAYTMTNLTKFRDRLIAVNGLAKLFSQTRKQEEGDEYLAGLWSSSVVRDLAWAAKGDLSWPPDLDTSTGQTSEKLDAHELDAQFVAPTWSWASVPGHVTWWDGLGDVDGFVFEPTLSVTRTHVTYLNQDPFGLALGGQLEVLAHVIPCALTWIRWHSWNLQIQDDRLLVDLDLDDRPRHHWDGLLERDTSDSGPNDKSWRFKNVYLIPLGHRKPDQFMKGGLQSDEITALLCRCVVDDNFNISAYKRLGLVTITMEYGQVPESLQSVFKEDGRKQIALL